MVRLNSHTEILLLVDHCLVVRASAWGAGSRGSTLWGLRFLAWCLTLTSYTTDWPAQSQYNGLSNSFLLTCGGIESVTSHSKKLGNLGSYLTTLSVYIYTCIQLHTPTNPTCSRWYDPERLKADFKPHPPPQMGEFNVQHVKTNMLKYGSTYLCRHLINCIQTLNAKKHEAHGSWGSTLLFKNYQGGLIIIIEVQYHIKHLFLLFSWKVFVVTS